jgi:ATP-dependent exoDNAse (exonuclease V) beta subunit
METVQLWYCAHCDRVFTPQRAKGKTYPMKVILEALMLYYRGETREHTSKRIRERYGMAIPARTLSTWLAEYRGFTTYARLRTKCSAGFPPNQIIRSVRLHHQQVYQYGIHRGKIAATLAAGEHRRFRPLDEYLAEMAEACPHQLFAAEARASQRKVAFSLDAVEIKTRRNHACRMAELVLQSVTQNKRRHDELQRFMLTTDSVTVAVEVPIYLSTTDLAYFKKVLGFHVPIESGTALTGHIDLLQIRNGAIHVLDYKPGARHERPIAQLMVYALALSRRTGLRLFDFVCAWFDEHDYFEFYPLHVVRKRQISEGL